MYYYFLIHYFLTIKSIRLIQRRNIMEGIFSLNTTLLKGVIIMLLLTASSCVASEPESTEEYKELDWSARWARQGVTMNISDGKVTLQNTNPVPGYPNRGYGRIEKVVEVDIDQTPILQIKVDEINPQVNTTWAVMIRDHTGGDDQVIADYVHLAGTWTYDLKEAFKWYDEDQSNKRLLLQLCAGGQGYVTFDWVRFLPAEEKNELENEVHIDLSKELNKFYGFGGQADSELLSVGAQKDDITMDEYEEVMKDVLDLGIRYVRVGIGPSFIAPYDDGSHPSEFNWDFYERMFNISYFKAVFEHLKYMTDNDIEVIIAFWGYPRWLKTPDEDGIYSISDGMIEKAVEIPLAFLYYTVKEKDIPINYVTFVNEPQWQHNSADPSQHSQIVRRLGERLRELDLDIELFEPDCGWASSSALWAEEVFKEAGEYLGPVSTHIYDTKVPSFIPQKIERIQDVIDSDATNPEDHPIWLGEYTAPGLWSGEIHMRPYDPDEHMLIDDYEYGFQLAEATHYHLNSNVSALILWELYDVLRYNDVQPKRWGAITYKWQNWRKRPLYYTFGMFSKYIPEDSLRVEAKSGTGLLSSAFKKDDTVVIVISNTLQEKRSVEVLIKDVSDFDSVKAYQTSEEKNHYVTQVQIVENMEDSLVLSLEMYEQSILALIIN